MVHHDVPKLKELSLLERLREQISDHVQARWYEYSRRPPQGLVSGRRGRTRGYSYVRDCLITPPPRQGSVYMPFMLFMQ